MQASARAACWSYCLTCLLCSRRQPILPVLTCLVRSYRQCCWCSRPHTAFTALPAAYLPGAELTLDEAKAAAELRRAHLQGLLDARTGEVDRIRAHLRLVEQSLADLAGLTAGSTA